MTTNFPKDKMAAIQQRLNRDADAIRNNRNYSDQGRRTEMAKLVQQARKQRDTLKNAYLAEREARRETLQRSLFGITGDATPQQLMILRDSRDRAAKIEGPEEAATKLALANQSGDTFMAQAIAMVAATKGWREVINAYADRAPAGTRTSLEELADIPTGPRTNFADAAAFSLREPAELAHYRTDSDIEHLAAQATDSAATGGLHFTGVPMA